jgi:hypothetical protein
MAIINGVGRIGIRNYVATQQITTSTLLNSLYSVWNADTLGTSLDTSIVGVWNAENSTNILDTNIYSVFTDLTTYTNTGLTNSQTGLWDAEGLGLDDKVGTNHLTSYNSATFSTDAIFGTKSFTFTTATQYFGLPVNSWNFTGDFSVSFWAKGNWGNGSIPISNCVWVQTTPTIKYSGWYIGFNAAKPYFYGVSGGTASFSVSSVVHCVNNSWTNVVVTKSNSVVSIYVNGFLGGTSSVTGNITYAATSYPSIGAQKYSSTGVSDHAGLSTPGCKFDNISTWTKVLSHDDVITLYNSGSGQSYPYTQPVTISVDKSQSLKGFVVGTGSSVVSGKTGNAISLTQSSAIILKDIYALKFTGDFSVSFWFKTSNVTTMKALISRHDGQRGWYVYILNGNILWASGGSVGVAFGFNPTTLVANTWYHVAVSLTNNVDVKAYLNGVLGGQQSMVSKTITYDYWNSYHPAVIGGRANNNGSSIYMDLPFNGIIDDINTWNRPITQNEVYQLYNGGDGVEYPYVGKLLSSPNDSVGTNHGTLMNGCTYTTGKIGNTFTFDGVNDLVSLPSGSLVFTGDFSVSVWVYASVLSGEKHIIANVHKEGGATGLWKGWNVFVYNNKVYFRIWNSGSASDCVQTSTFTTGQWYLITVTKKGSSQKLYINGILESTNNSALTPNYSSPNFPTIGTSWYYTGYNSVGYDYSYCWNGKIDGVTTWQKELTSDEVTQLYNVGTGAQYPFSSQTLPSAKNQFAIDNGTLMNGCTLTDGKIGKAFTFDGVNDYVALPDNSLNFIGDFTTSFWFYANAFAGQDSFVTCENWVAPNDNGWYIYHYQGNLAFSVYNGTNATGWKTSTSITTGTWYHVVVVKNRSVSPKFYINGALVGTVLRTGADTTLNPGYVTTQYCSLGTDRYAVSTAQAYLNGKMDGVNVWQREITQAEVTELYNSGTGKQLTPTPIITNGLLLNLDASRLSSYPNTGTTWYDISGNVNNGTLTNGPIFATASGGQITFDGIDDNVNMGSNSAFNLTNISISIWVKLDTTASNNFIVGRYFNTTVDNGWVIYYSPTTQKILFIGRESEALFISNQSTNNYNVNTWYNIVCTKSANTWSIYSNGVLDMSQSIGLGNVAFANNNMQFGGMFTNFGNNYGKHSIGSIHMYNRALSATEITQNFNATKSRFGL